MTNDARFWKEKVSLSPPLFVGAGEQGTFGIDTGLIGHCLFGGRGALKACQDSPKKVHQSAIWASTLLYYTSLNIWDVKYDQHRNPNINNRDHLVGQLTRWELGKY